MKKRFKEQDSVFLRIFHPLRRNCYLQNYSDLNFLLILISFKTICAINVFISEWILFAKILLTIYWKFLISLKIFSLKIVFELDPYNFSRASHLYESWDIKILLLTGDGIRNLRFRTTLFRFYWCLETFRG